MGRTREEEKQMWDDMVAKYQRTIAEHESEIASISNRLECEPQNKALTYQIRHFYEEIKVQRVCLLEALERRRSLEG